MPLPQVVNHPLAKSTPLVLGVCFLDIVVAALLVSCKYLVDVHGALAEGMWIFCL